MWHSAVAFATVLFFFSNYSWANFSYESCECNLNSYAESFMKKLTESKTEAQNCDQCSKASKQNSFGFISGMQKVQKESNNIPEACLIAGMQVAAKIPDGKSGYYSACRKEYSKKDDYPDKEKGMKTMKAGSKCEFSGETNVRRPCLSKSLVSATKRSLEEVGQCVDPLNNGGDIKPLLPLLAHESQFLNSRRSHTGAACLGQMTGIAIHEAGKVLTGKWGTFSKELQKKLQNNDECLPALDAVKEAFGGIEGMPQSSKHPSVKYRNHRCEFVRDPRLCLLYTFALIKLNRTKTEKIVQKSRAKFASDEDREKVIHYITTWSHNAGSSLYDKKLKIFLNDVWSHKGINPKDFAGFKKWFEKMIEIYTFKLTGDKKKSDRIANFPNRVRDDLSTYIEIYNKNNDLKIKPSQCGY